MDKKNNFSLSYLYLVTKVVVATGSSIQKSQMENY